MPDHTDNWFHERESAWLYRQVARAEPDPHKKDLFLALATGAERQAEIWERAGGAFPPFKPSFRARLVAGLVRCLGPRPLKPALAALKMRGLSVYDGRHPGHAMPTSVHDFGKRHRRFSGGNLRATVFGVNDGLVSNTGLILGVAGAGADPQVVVTTGVAGLLAGALSMAAGEYVSMRSQREMYEYQIGLEREELAQYPEEEAEELALIYHARGLELEQARSMSRQLLQDPEQALLTLSREELGLNPDDLGSAWGAAGFSFFSFAVGAALPVLPFLLGAARTLTVVIGLCAMALFGVGMAISLFTGRSAWRSGLRMVLIGAAAGAVTWSIGRLLGVGLS
jgi:VIT1/CCC1 family predicted Fe2+/Mn2+ transporter